MICSSFIQLQIKFFQSGFSYNSTSFLMAMMIIALNYDFSHGFFYVPSSFPSLLYNNSLNDFDYFDNDHHQYDHNHHKKTIVSTSTPTTLFNLYNQYTVDQLLVKVNKK